MEAVERAGPQLAVGRQPLVDLGQRLRPQAVHPPLGAGTHVDQPRVAQHPQVLRHGGLAELQLGHEISDGALAAAQQVEDLPSMGLCEHCERSEEHTSELQSLMRISYAVFCLKKK